MHASAAFAGSMLPPWRSPAREAPMSFRAEVTALGRAPQGGSAELNLHRGPVHRAGGARARLVSLLPGTRNSRRRGAPDDDHAG